MSDQRPNSKKDVSYNSNVPLDPALPSNDCPNPSKAIAENPTPYVDKFDPWSSHGRILSILSKMPAGKRILDVGTATGTIGRMCKETGHYLYGVEPNPEWAKIAKPYYEKLYVSLLENCPDDFLRYYDVVICADVLEHMTDPESALRRLVMLQNNGSVFLISVPNIANLWVRLNLLFGRFEYAERGILDRTHLRFFTQKSFLALVNSAGLRVNRVHATPIPLFLAYPALSDQPWGYAILNVLRLITDLFPRLLGYQILVEAEKPMP